MKRGDVVPGARRAGGQKENRVLRGNPAGLPPAGGGRGDAAGGRNAGRRLSELDVTNCIMLLKDRKKLEELAQKNLILCS